MVLSLNSFFFVCKPLIAEKSVLWFMECIISSGIWQTVSSSLHYLVPELPFLFYEIKDFRTAGRWARYVIPGLCLTGKYVPNRRDGALVFQPGWATQPTVSSDKITIWYFKVSQSNSLEKNSSVLHTCLEVRVTALLVGVCLSACSWLFLDAQPVDWIVLFEAR